MTITAPSFGIKVGDKIKCISNIHGYVDENNHLLEIGKVYTVAEVAPMSLVMKHTLKVTLVEINKYHPEGPFFVAEDFELVSFNSDDAWDRAMRGI